MASADLLSEKAIALGTSGEMVDKLTRKRTRGTNEIDGVLANSQIMDLTEFGRVVHAEMSAICDAARLGRSVKGATLFVTTFPCHNCAKHILGAGIKRVVYMEPYPKSRAKTLHANEIEVERAIPGKVSFVPFLGISPFRYRDIFQKGRRKNPDGTARRWLSVSEKPMVDPGLPIYFEIEVAEFGRMVGEIKTDRGDSPPAAG